MTTTKTRESGNAPGLSGLPAPLPSLPAAFSRRRAIFGAVVAAAVPGALLKTSGAAAAEQPVALHSADARLVALADELHAVDAACAAHAALYRGRETDATEDEFDDLVASYSPLESEMAETPAASMAGILAKVRALQIRCVRDTSDHSGIALSIADDLARLHGVAPIAAEPPRTFSPAAYIADLRAAGVEVRPCPDGESYFVSAKPGRGIGNAYGDVQAKWARARRDDADPVGRVFHTLMAEA